MLIKVAQQTPPPPWAEGPFLPARPMKKIEAIIKPFKLYEVRDALAELGFEGMTIIETQGMGRRRDQTASVRADEFSTEFLPKVKVELVVADKMADRAVSV